jgi:hypothetical protein
LPGFSKRIPTGQIERFAVEREYPPSSDRTEDDIPAPVLKVYTRGGQAKRLLGGDFSQESKFEKVCEGLTRALPEVADRETKDR